MDGPQPTPGDRGARAAVGASATHETSDAPVIDSSENPAVEHHDPLWVQFRLGGNRYLADVEAVLEVLVGLPITRLPGAVEAIIGVTSVRGRIVAVVDPAEVLATTSPVEERTRFLVVTTPTGPVALLVDHVDAVVSAPRRSEQDATGDEDGTVAEPRPDDPAIVSADAVIGDRLVPVVEVAAIVRAIIETEPDAADGRRAEVAAMDRR